MISIETTGDSTDAYLLVYQYKADDLLVAHVGDSTDERQYFKPGHVYILTVSFVGYTLNDNVGFYRSSYLDAKGQKR